MRRENMLAVDVDGTKRPWVRVWGIRRSKTVMSANHYRSED